MLGEQDVPCPPYGRPKLGTFQLMAVVMLHQTSVTCGDAMYRIGEVDLSAAASLPTARYTSITERLTERHPILSPA